MKIEFIHDKGSRILSEDQYLIKDNLFAVFDGATAIAITFDQDGS